MHLSSSRRDGVSIQQSKWAARFFRICTRLPWKFSCSRWYLWDPWIWCPKLFGKKTPVVMLHDSNFLVLRSHWKRIEVHFRHKSNRPRHRDSQTERRGKGIRAVGVCMLWWCPFRCAVPKNFVVTIVWCPSTDCCTYASSLRVQSSGNSPGLWRFGLFIKDGCSPALSQSPSTEPSY